MLNELSTEPQLHQNIVAGFPNTKKRQHATNEVTIVNVEFIPYVGTKMLHVRSNTRSTNGNRYHQSIQFTNVAFESQSSDTNVTFTGADGVEYNIVPIILMDHNVKVRCDCLDFYFRFANWNFSDKSIVGRAPVPYHRKTLNHPEVNPNHTPGMCKHIIKIIEHMHQQQLLS